MKEKGVTTAVLAAVIVVIVVVTGVGAYHRIIQCCILSFQVLGSTYKEYV